MIKPYFWPLCQQKGLKLSSAIPAAFLLLFTALQKLGRNYNLCLFFAFVFFSSFCFTPSYRSWLKYIPVTEVSIVRKWENPVTTNWLNYFFSSVFSKIYEAVCPQKYLSLSSFSSFDLHIGKSDRPKELSNFSISDIISWPGVSITAVMTNEINSNTQQ